MEHVHFFLKDVLHYASEEIKMMDLETYYLALDYAIVTYLRRDLAFVLSQLNKGMEQGGKGKKPTLDFTFKHDDIEQYIREQYGKDKQDHAHQASLNKRNPFSPRFNIKDMKKVNDNG